MGLAAAAASESGGAAAAKSVHSAGKWDRLPSGNTSTR